jgi:hypothetical protein
MFRKFLCALAAATFCSAASAASQPSPHPELDEMIARHARNHGVPEHLVHRVVIRESRYNPACIHRRFYGLMQITHETAKSMGYKGAPRGLLDPDVNLTYAVPYLANAYKVAGGDESRAVALYAGGYYYVAKRKKMLGELRNATSPSLAAPSPVVVPAVAEAPTNPVVQLFQLVSGAPQTNAVQPSPEQASQGQAVPEQAGQMEAAQGQADQVQPSSAQEAPSQTHAAATSVASSVGQAPAEVAASAAATTVPSAPVLQKNAPAAKAKQTAAKQTTAKQASLKPASNASTTRHEAKGTNPSAASKEVAASQAAAAPASQ